MLSKKGKWRLLKNKIKTCRPKTDKNIGNIAMAQSRTDFFPSVILVRFLPAKDVCNFRFVSVTLYFDFHSFYKMLTVSKRVLSHVVVNCNTSLRCFHGPRPSLSNWSTCVPVAKKVANVQNILSKSSRFAKQLIFAVFALHDLMKKSVWQ